MTSSNEMRDTMTKHVERGELPGLVTLVSRHGDVRVEVIGTKANDAPDPMQRGTIFRIASMTKPIAAAAAMTLVEEGRARLDDPVDTLLPELADRRVLRSLESALDDTVPAKRAITLRDLLTFRMGFGIVWAPPDTYPIQTAERELALGAFGPPKPQLPPAPDEWIRRFGTLPLMHQPGERWMYNTSAEVLGVFLARAAGKPLEVMLHERILDPLGMKDTAFSVPAAKLDRFPTSYVARKPFEPDEGGYELYDGVADGQWARPPSFPSCGAGLVSTVDDYLAFGTMLLNRGMHDGRRVVSEASVAAMTSDQLTADQKALSEFKPEGYWNNHGWGFGLAIVTAPDDLTATSGRYGWDGGLGTSWCSDPGRGIVAILMTQRSAFPPCAGVYRDFWRTVYSA